MLFDMMAMQPVQNAIACAGFKSMYFLVSLTHDTCPKMLLKNFLFLSRVATCQGKLGGKQNFLQIRELSGNFEKMSGNLGQLTNVMEFCQDN